MQDVTEACMGYLTSLLDLRQSAVIPLKKNF